MKLRYKKLIWFVAGTIILWWVMMIDSERINQGEQIKQLQEQMNNCLGY